MRVCRGVSALLAGLAPHLCQRRRESLERAPLGAGEVLAILEDEFEHFLRQLQPLEAHLSGRERGGRQRLHRGHLGRV